MQSNKRQRITAGNAATASAKAVAAAPDSSTSPPTPLPRAHIAATVQQQKQHAGKRKPAPVAAAAGHAGAQASSATSSTTFPQRYAGPALPAWDFTVHNAPLPVLQQYPLSQASSATSSTSGSAHAVQRQPQQSSSRLSTSLTSSSHSQQPYTLPSQQQHAKLDAAPQRIIETSPHVDEYVRTLDFLYNDDDKDYVESVLLTSRQLLDTVIQDYEHDIQQCHDELLTAGHSLGQQLFDEFIPRTKPFLVYRCDTFRDTLLIVAKLALHYYLGISGDIVDYVAELADENELQAASSSAAASNQYPSATLVEPQEK